MSERKVYAVNLNSISGMLAFKRCAYNPEFDEACAGCIDAPIWYPAGSTVILHGDGELVATIASRVERADG